MKSLEHIISTGAFPVPKFKQSIYKNRRGKYKSVILWCEGDLGTCRLEPVFLTDNNYELLPIEDIKISVIEETSAF